MLLVLGRDDRDQRLREFVLPPRLEEVKAQVGRFAVEDPALVSGENIGQFVRVLIAIFLQERPQLVNTKRLPGCACATVTMRLKIPGSSLKPAPSGRYPSMKSS
jgi:hypothetical protein